jgi:hypothetical protein
MILYGLDFTSRPTRRKPLTLAEGRPDGNRLRLTALHRLETFAAWEAILATPGPWLMACDFPFGLPRDLIRYLGWPATSWAATMAQLTAVPRASLEALFKPYRDARPPGQKYAHRAADRAASSSSSMKLVNPPVGLMLYEGAPRLLHAGVTLPGLRQGDPDKIALEAYPALLARRVLGRVPYKNDDPAKQTTEHTARRIQLLEQADQALGLCLEWGVSRHVAEQAITDPGGDSVDAVLCLLQATWAWQRRAENFGLPDRVDPLEGWIATAPPNVD